jgi:predicted O-methyltransferase YrrM
MAPSPVIATQKVLDLLDRLHTASKEQERTLRHVAFWIQKYLTSRRQWTARDDDFMRDKFIALPVDKSHFIYLLARSIGAVNIVEAGTSFGVSTIYLALAAGQNAAAQAGGNVTPGQGARVLGTEMEPTKAQKAREYWKEAGEEVEPWITLLEGDLRETLAPEVEKLDKVDFLLLDSMLYPRLLETSKYSG